MIDCIIITISSDDGPRVPQDHAERRRGRPHPERTATGQGAAPRPGNGQGRGERGLVRPGDSRRRGQAVGSTVQPRAEQGPTMADSGAAKSQGRRYGKQTTKGRRGN